MLEKGFIKIIDCFDIKGLGLITEIQHNENGIPPNTLLVNTETNESWNVKKRVVSGVLLIGNDREVYFDCETAYTHESLSFKSPKEQEIAIQKELERRKNGIYWYLLKPKHKHQTVKPTQGSFLKIDKTPNKK